MLLVLLRLDAFFRTLCQPQVHTGLLPGGVVSPSFSETPLGAFGPDLGHEFAIGNDSITISIEFLSRCVGLLIADEEASTLHQVPYFICRNQAALIQVADSEGLRCIEVRVPAQVLPHCFSLVFTAHVLSY